MKKLDKIVVLSMLLLPLLFSTASWKMLPLNKENKPKYTESKTAGKLNIRIGEKSYQATLVNNKTTEVFQVMLPLNLDMTDYNSNEKKFDLSVNLPTQVEDIGTIHEGDILLWGNHTIVLFYKSFKTQYRYTKIGKLDDAQGLASVLGKSDVKVRFEME
ncbi:cyclophilin-like fold protein [Aquirufa ecclesiirivi]